MLPANEMILGIGEQGTEQESRSTPIPLSLLGGFERVQELLNHPDFAFKLASRKHDPVAIRTGLQTHHEKAPPGEACRRLWDKQCSLQLARFTARRRNPPEPVFLPACICRPDLEQDFASIRRPGKMVEADDIWLLNTSELSWLAATHGHDHQG